jgi:hypothetical protein
LTEYQGDGYFTVPISYVSGNASGLNNFTNNLEVLITFARTGD